MDNTSFDTFSLEEIASDLSEAQRFGDLLEQQGLLKAPTNLKASVLERSRQADVRLIANGNRLSKRTELIRYSLKVSLAAACSIAVIVTVPSRDRDHVPPLHMEAYEKMQILTGKFVRFSRSLLNLEVFFDD